MSTQITLQEEEIIVRDSTSYHPTIWGDYFISYTFDPLTMEAWCKEANILKEEIKRMLTIDYKTKSLEEKLDLIDVVQRLGISYHFTHELQEALKQMRNYFENCCYDVKGDNLRTSSLMFRLLREHGYNVSCDIFNKLKDTSGGFKEGLANDIEGLLNLYEASELRVRGEDILEEAFDFSRSNLESIVSDMKDESFIVKLVKRALNRSLRKCLPILESREYMILFEANKSYEKTLLKFSKLHFNILQKQHQMELSTITKWWKKLDVPKNYPFARDRIVECYFWILGAYHEPQYALARKFLTQAIALTSIMDDIFDNYGIYEELEIFTHAVESWKMSDIDRLPDYMKICYGVLIDVYDEMEEEMAKEGRAYAVAYAKEAMKGLIKAYFEEKKWLVREYIPTKEEYMKVATVTLAYPMLIITSFVGMGEIATKEVFEWALSDPKIIKAVCFVLRTLDDIVTNELEQQRKHIPSIVQCYMNEFQVSKEETYTIFRNEINEGWKDITQGIFEASEIPMPFLMRILNMTRFVDELYREEDCYTKSYTIMKQYITSMMVDPMKID